MAVTIKTTAEVESLFNTMRDEVEKSFQTSLNYLGNKYVKHARELSEVESFKDDTGNLRSSIGYAVENDGEILTKSEFKKVRETANKAQSEGDSSLLRASAERSYGLWLILVAGMDYASYVEAMENKNVLARTINQIKQDQESIAKMVSERVVSDLKGIL